MNIKELDSEFVASTYGRFNAVLENGKSSTITDENGKEYIDFGSGIGVTSFGICDDIWKNAVKSQLDKLQHTSNLYYTEPCVELAELLCEKTGMSKVFFGNSGAEANECAIKAARKYSFDKYGDGKSTIITLTDSFHGRTITTLAATGQDCFHTIFGPFTGGFKYAKSNDIADLQCKVDDTVCAIMFECIQGEGGVNVLDKDFVKAIEKICNEKDILMIVDEVQTGNGRCGKMYCYENFDIKPDIVSTAKGLAGGLPMGACLLGEKVKDTLTPGSHGSTFGGNPICAAGAVSIVKRLDENMFADVMKKSKIITDFCKNINGVKGVSGIGLMLGVETNKNAGEVAKECLKNGLLVLTAKTKVRLLPALTITEDELNKGLNILKGVIEK